MNKEDKQELIDQLESMEDAFDTLRDGTNTIVKILKDNSPLGSPTVDGSVSPVTNQVVDTPQGTSGDVKSTLSEPKKEYEITVCDKCGDVIESEFGNFCADCENTECRDIIVIEKDVEDTLSEEEDATCPTCGKEIRGDRLCECITKHMKETIFAKDTKGETAQNTRIPGKSDVSNEKPTAQDELKPFDNSNDVGYSEDTQCEHEWEIYCGGVEHGHCLEKDCNHPGRLCRKCKVDKLDVQDRQHAPGGRE